MVGVPDTEESRASCLCGSCPSKPADDMTFYCVSGKSPAPVTRGFCACNWCPVWSCYGMTSTFHCDEGPAGDSNMTGDEEATDGDPAAEDEAGGNGGSAEGDQEAVE